MRKQRFSKSKQAGFTLIEVLIASTIIAFAAGSVMMLAQSATRVYDAGLERTQAYLLVQEGLEIVRSIRDNQSLDDQANNWADILPGPGPIDYRPIWQATTGRWQLQTGLETIQPDNSVNLRFTRTIHFETPPDLPSLVGPDGTPVEAGIASNVRRVTVNVNWDQAGQPANVKGTTLLTNWQPED